jgi:hypothetical protein
MRLRVPYTEAEIHATPYEYDRPFAETRRGKMWQARIDYFGWWARFFGVLTGVAVVVTAVSIVLLVAR